MKRRTVLLVFVILIAVGVAMVTMKPGERTQTVQTGSALPDFELIDTEQNTTRLSALKGSVVFINFWSTWCTSCVEEMPSIERMYRLLADNPSFKVVTILYKDDQTRARAFLAKHGYTFPMYVNPDDSAARIFGITGIPESFIVDKQGSLRAKVIGPADWDSPRMIEMFRTLMNES